jgi:MFS family permease
LARALAPLSNRPYRTYLGGHAVASTGVWMQNIATDWLVLELTGSPAAVGVTMACQFAPVLLLGLHAGMLADRFPKRTLLLITQACFLLLTATLAALTLTGAARVELVWLLALLGGCVTAVDGPARQAFAGELVPAEHLRGAVSLNSAVFQTSRLLGPAVAATLISTVGTGWAFAATAACFTAPLVALSLLRPADLLSPAGAAGGGGAAGGAGRERGGVRAALRHVRERPHVAMTIVLVGVVGTFGLNFPVVLTAMASEELGGGPQLYGAFNTALALGSTAGALLAGSRATTRLRLIVLTCAAFGLLQAAAALAPSAAVFLVVLVAVGLVNLAFQAMANSSVQLWVDPALRGRVMGLYLLAFVGGTPVGAPLVGAITETWGPRVGMAVCGLVPAVAAVVVAAVVVRRERAGRRAPASSPLAVAVTPTAQVPAVTGDLATGGAAAASLPSRAWQPAPDAPASSSSAVTPPAWPAPRRRSSRPRPAGATSRWSRSSAAARPRTRPAGSRTGSGAS